MALADLQVLLQELLQRYDERIDVTEGSAAFQKIIQPVLDRVGTDPFSVDLPTFITQRLLETYPQVLGGVGVEDFLMKTSAVLFDPIVREVNNIKQRLSLRDPSLLTTDEAAALGANYFSEMNPGKRSVGVARIYFGRPRTVSVTAVNYLTSRSGLRFFPSYPQSIRTEQMVLNTEGGQYYFDINVIAEREGTGYNLGPDEIIAVAGLATVLRVTNKRRFRDAVDPEDSVDYIERLRSDIGERSLVTSPGVSRVLPNAFPEIQHIAVVGMNEPEMQRDILEGGGYGPILFSGTDGQAIPDRENRTTTRRLHLPSFNASELGPVGPVSSTYYITVINAFGASNPPFVRDLKVRAVVDAHTIDVEEQVLVPVDGIYWAIRQKTLTVSGLVGGLIDPPETVELHDDEVHIGGCADVYVASNDVDEDAVVLTSVFDNEPSLQGSRLRVLNTLGDVRLEDFILGTDYMEGDSVYETLVQAYLNADVLQITNGPTGLSGSYRIVQLTQAVGVSPVLRLYPAPAVFTGLFTWLITDTVEVDINDPRQVRVAGSDLSLIQGEDLTQFGSSVDFAALGVGVGDTLRILTGANKGDYGILAVLPPFNSVLKLDRQALQTETGLKYEVFRSMTSTPFEFPILRIKSVDVLDTNGQPIGVKVPYSKMVDCQTNAFSNPSRGIKQEARDIRLGLVSSTNASTLTVGQLLGLTLVFQDENVPGTYTISFAPSGSPGDPYPLSALVADLNAFFGADIVFMLSYSTDINAPYVAFGIMPKNGVTDVMVVGGTARAVLFGDPNFIGSTKDVRSQQVTNAGGWESVFRIDSDYDVLEIIDGSQIGIYNDLQADPTQPGRLITNHRFYPELQRHARMGARSLGTVRCYFLEPTTVEFNLNSTFTYNGLDGSVLEYVPDRRFYSTRIPYQPSGSVPTDGTPVPNTDTFTSASIDFLQAGVLVGDLLVINYVVVEGSVLPDPCPLVGKNLIFSYDDSPDKVLVFTQDSVSIPAGYVTRQGVVDQINQTLGTQVASLDGSNRLVLQSTVSLVIRAVSTANNDLGFSTLVDTTNTSPLFGTYVIQGVEAHTLTLGLVFGAGPYPVSMFHVDRAMQRFGTTLMNQNVGPNGLYYVDVELVSQGTGDTYNLPAGVQLMPSGYLSEGYCLTTDNKVFSFSTYEKSVLHLSKTFHEVGSNDDPGEAIYVTGMSLQVVYEYSSLVRDIQSFITSAQYRVLVESSLARHLTPYYIFMDFTYAGGPGIEQMNDLFTEMIRNTDASEPLRLSKFVKAAEDAGATSVEFPLEIVALKYGQDRVFWAERSNKEVGTDSRLSVYIPERLRLTRLAT